jgi:two-component system cell cycle response regulator
MPDTPSTGSPPAPSTADLERELPGLEDTSVLIVDDNLQNLELLQAYLEELPCAVHTATDGVEAMEAIGKGDVDLVLLDVMMPRMSGFEVCQKIKTSPSTRDVVVIMVTALHEVGDFERAIESGTDDFLTKPINKLELLTRVRSLLRVRILRRKMDQLLQHRGGAGADERRSHAGDEAPPSPPPAH